MMDFLFGRPLTETIKMFGLKETKNLSSKVLFGEP